MGKKLSNKVFFFFPICVMQGRMCTHIHMCTVHIKARRQRSRETRSEFVAVVGRLNRRAFSCMSVIKSDRISE